MDYADGVLVLLDASPFAKDKPLLCSAPISTRSSEKAEKLTMKYLSGAFLILVAGMLISLVVFVLEIIYYQCHQCRLAPSPFARKANEEHLANRQHHSIVI